VAGGREFVIYAASTERAVGLVVFAILMVGWIGYVFVNIRQSKAELGSEVELAPNRKVMPTDEEFEGPRLEQVQAWGVLFLAVIGLALPLYWLREPGRQDGALNGFEERSISRGETEFVDGFQCANCHGADLSGGSTSTIIDIPRNGTTVKVQVNFDVPSLNDVFYRFDTGITDPEDATEVRSILNFGRAPVMPAWGLPGGGPANEQQIQDLVEYLWANQIEPEEAQQKWNDRFVALRDDPANSAISNGQLLYELHCARCHTPQWNTRGNQQQPTGLNVEIIPGEHGAGAYGRPLNVSSLQEQFPDAADQVDFVGKGAEQDAGYGTKGLGNYGMPGFEAILSEDELELVVNYVRTLTQTPGVTGVAGPEEAAE
jgi:mono/diheme cytochrome c family protein